MTHLKFVIGILGAVLLAAVVGIIMLASQEKAIPDVLQNIGVGALTGLVGVLVPSRSAGDPGGNV